MPTTLVDMINNDEILAKRAEQDQFGNVIDETYANLARIADEYTEKTYKENEFCIYEGLLYKCLADINTPEAFNANHWKETKITDEYSQLDNYLDNHFTDIYGVKKLGTLKIYENDSDKVYAGAIFSVICRQTNSIDWQGFLCIRKFEYSSSGSYGNTANVSKFVVINDSNNFQTSANYLKFYTYVPAGTHDIEIWCSAQVRVGLTLLNSSMKWEPVTDHVVGELPSGSETVKYIRLTVDEDNKMPFIGIRKNTDNFTDGISYGDYYASNTAICGWKVLTTTATSEYETNSFNGILMVDDWTGNPDSYTTSRFIGTIEIYHRMNSGTPSPSATVYGARLVQVNSAASLNGWTIFAKTTELSNGHQIDWYVGKINSNHNGIDQSVKYSKITILPLEQVASGQLYRKMERLSTVIDMTKIYPPLVNVNIKNGCTTDAGTSVGNGVYVSQSRIVEQKLKSVIVDVPCRNSNTTGKAIRLAHGSIGSTNYSSFRFRTSTGNDLCDLTVTLNEQFNTAIARGVLTDNYENIKPSIYLDPTNKYLYIWWPTLASGTSGIQTGNYKRVYIDYAYDTSANPSVDVVDIPAVTTGLTYVKILFSMGGKVICYHPTQSEHDSSFRIIRTAQGESSGTGLIKLSEMQIERAYFYLIPGDIGECNIKNDTGSRVTYHMYGDSYAVDNNSDCSLTCSSSNRGCNVMFVAVRTNNSELWVFRGY